MAEARKSPINILTIGLYQHLHGSPLTEALDAQWEIKADQHTQSSFNNIAFDLDPTDVTGTLGALRKTIREQSWDGITVGWCTRGNPDRTQLFEEVIETCVAETAGNGRKTRLMFSTGPENLVETTLRNFPVA